MSPACVQIYCLGVLLRRPWPLMASQLWVATCLIPLWRCGCRTWAESEQFPGNSVIPFSITNAVLRRYWFVGRLTPGPYMITRERQVHYCPDVQPLPSGAQKVLGPLFWVKAARSPKY